MPIIKNMIKYFRCLALVLLMMTVSPLVPAQTLGNYYYPYYYHTGPSYWSTMTGYDKAYFGINQFFNAVNYSLRTMEQTKAYEQRYQLDANRLENAKSLQRYYTEGIPAFSPVAPNGQARSEKIKWQDVDSIRP